MGSTRKLIFLTSLLFLSCGAHSNINPSLRSVYGVYADQIDPRTLADTDSDGVRDYWDLCVDRKRGERPINDGKSDFSTRLYYWTVGCPYNTVIGK